MLEHLEMVAGDRRQRRVERASKLPPAATFGTLQDERLPRPLAQKLADLD